MTDLNATAVSVLGFLHRGPLTGWEVARTVTETIGDFWNVTRSQVYRELRTLEAAGLVRAGETGPRDRRPYTLTDEGRRAFSRAIDRDPGDDIIRSPLLLTVFFGAHADPDRLRRHLTVHRLRHEDRLRAYRDLMAALAGTGDETRFDRAALAYGIEHEQSVLRWFDRLPTLLGDERAPSQT